MPLMNQTNILARQNTQFGRRRNVFNHNKETNYAPADLLAIYQISDQIIEKVDDHIEQIKARNIHRNDAEANLKEESVMMTIMQMVKANSQLDPIQGLILNTVNNLPVFVQLIHNTTDDSIILLFIKDFNTLKIEEVPLVDIIHHSQLKILLERYGQLN